MLKRYEIAYWIGVTPWERYPVAAAASVARLLDREEAVRSRPLGRALDLGCGRGHYTRELARRGWDAVGVDAVPRAIDAAKREGVAGARFVVGDVTDLAGVSLGTFDLFLDVGCFQGLTSGHRLAEGRAVHALANPAATLLLLAFQPTKMRSLAGGVSHADVEAAFHGWEMLAVEPADTAGLGWPLNRTAPQWYRLGRQVVGSG
jgi:SAM-dependent methyltransferase